jgi:glycosyltransferase involved in cell wall biosynthesis
VGDIQSTVRAILELSQSPSQLINMSKAARERALELSWFNVAQKMEEIYINLVRK